MGFPDVIFRGGELTDEETLERLPADFRRYLTEVQNGCLALNGGLHIRGAVSEPDWHSLRDVWSGEHAFHATYASIEPTDVPFGQDCFGDQFLIRDGIVIQLIAETGDVDDRAASFDDFLRETEADPVGYLGLESYLEFVEQQGPLAPGELLNVYPPFCSEEAEQGVSLAAIPMRDRLGFLAELATQIAAMMAEEDDDADQE